MKWIARKRPKNELMATSEAGATAYDVPSVEMSHVGDFFSCDALPKKYELHDPALQRAEIVRGADTSILDLTPQSAGLFAISLRRSANFADGHEMARHGMIMYDALCAWCQQCQLKRTTGHFNKPTIFLFRRNAMPSPNLFRSSLLALSFAASTVSAYATDVLIEADAANIEKITGLKGTLSKEENVFKVSKPRNDVKVKVDKWSMPAFMGLTSWAAFTPAPDARVMLMGDTVVFEDEVNPAISAALDAGLDVTALHNHFFFDQPKVYFMHLGGTGDASKLATGVKKVYDKIAEIRSANPTPATQFPGTIPVSSKISSEPLEKILGVKGESKNGMFKVTVGRPAVMHGVSIGKEMGVNTWAAFAGSDNQAVVDGDFVVREDELQASLKILRSGAINIVAIHQHMTREEPRYLFFHYWGKGNAQDLAKTIKKALDLQTNPVATQTHGKR